MERKINVGIIGMGRIGKMHTENITRLVDGITIKSVADPLMNEEIKEFGRRFLIKEFYTDGEYVINDSNIDAVLICSSSNTHLQLIEAAARAGKDIFCEKPIDTDIQRVVRAINVVKENSTLLQVGFNKRFDIHHRSVKRAIDEGIVGDIHIIKMVSRNFTPPPLDYVKAAGGLFIDSLIHEFDLARYISGKEIKRVFAVGGALVQKELRALGEIDTAVVTLIMDDNVICLIDFSRQAKYGYDQRIEVLGSEGIVMDNNVGPLNRVIGTAGGFYKDVLYKGFKDRFRDSYVEEIKSFYEAVINRTTPEVSIYDGLMPIVAAKAAEKSLQEKRIVEIQEIMAKEKIVWK